MKQIKQLERSMNASMGDHSVKQDNILQE